MKIRRRVRLTRRALGIDRGLLVVNVLAVAGVLAMGAVNCEYLI